MLDLVTGKWYAAQVRMLLTAAQVQACLVASPGTPPSDPHPSLRQFIIQNNLALQECISELGKEKGLRLQSADPSGLGHETAVLVYPVRVHADDAEAEGLAVRASDLVGRSVRMKHINIVSLDVPPEDVFGSSAVQFAHSLNLSRLGIDDSVVTQLTQSGSFHHLRRLDVSGNAAVSVVGVRAICESVQAGRFLSLEWLDLLGTDCDATPFVDGHYWRMTDEAQELAKEYGHQPWMMLGSRLPGMANLELLTSAQRKQVYYRFRRDEEIR